MGKINVAIAGVGSFTKALVEGVSYYTKNPNDYTGLLHPQIGEYSIGDINFVCAFDVDDRKIGKPLHEAIGLGMNITREIDKPIEYDAIVYRGPTLDGVIEQMKDTFVFESSKEAEDVVKILKEKKVDVLVNLVPSGSDEATFFYAQKALEAGCNFINCIPTPLATVDEWRSKFEEKGLVVLGDDTKSQLGATMLNRFLLQILQMRGIKVTQVEQHNKGGNADHFNLRYRSASKEKSKSSTLSKFLDISGAVKPIVTFEYTDSPSGHKLVELKVEGEMFGKIPITINAQIEDEISINGASTAVDAIRVAKFLQDTGKQKLAPEVCPFLMKTTSVGYDDIQANEVFSKIIRKSE